MIFAVYYIVPVLILFSLINRQRSRYIDLEYQFKFYSLRDELRNLAIVNKVETRNPFYQSLENDITQASSNFKLLNLYNILYFILFQKEYLSDEVQARSFDRKRYKNAHELLKIKSEYSNLLYKYLLAKNAYLVIIVGYSYKFYKFVVSPFLKVHSDFFFKQQVAFRNNIANAGTAISYSLS